jgi:hypothetical protein
MARRWAIALLAVLAVSGCDEDDGKDAAPSPAVPRAVQVELDLPRPQAGAPDAGTQAGHGGDRYLLKAEVADPIVSGRMNPPSALVELADAAGTRIARVNVARDGSFDALLPRLPASGVVTFRLSAAAGDAEPARTEIVASRAPAGGAPASVRVPASDRTPPAAALLLQSGGRVVSSVAPVRSDRDRPLRLARPVLDLTAITRDADGGSGRVRVSLTYVRSCGSERTRRTLYFPPSEIARVRLAPGTIAPAERRRHARVRLETGGRGCTVRGKAWADATNASGLESFSDQTAFGYSARGR